MRAAEKSMRGRFARAPAHEQSPELLARMAFVRLEAARAMAQPLLDRLEPNWMLAGEALDGLNYPEQRAFWACELGLAEVRRRGLPWHRRAWMRLTRKGWAEA